MKFTWNLVQRRQGETVLDFLLRNPHIRRCVRTIRFCAVAEQYSSQLLDFEKLREVLPLLTSLQEIQYRC